MLNKTIEKVLNDQLEVEYVSAHLYRSMAAYFDSIALHGCRKWMTAQADEEMGHVNRILDHLSVRGGRIKIPALKAPKASWRSALAVFEDAYKHEVAVTKSIHRLVDLAIQKKDHATNQFLQWFVEEQVEEESTIMGIIEEFKLTKGSHSALFMIDRELGKRSNNA